MKKSKTFFMYRAIETFSSNGNIIIEGTVFVVEDYLALPDIDSLSKTRLDVYEDITALFGRS